MVKRVMVGLLAVVAAAVLWSRASATVPSTTSSVTYTCSGTASFPVPFRFLDSAHLVVTTTSATGVVTTLSRGPHYAAAGAGAASGSVTLTSATWCPSGGTLTIKRQVPVTQTTSLPTNGSFSPKTHEAAFDRLTMQLQDTSRENDAKNSQQDAALAAGAVGGSGTMVTASGGPTRSAADWAAMGPVSASSTAVTAKGGTVARDLGTRANDIIWANDRGADPAYDGTTNRLAFQKAADDLGARGGGELAALPGTYQMYGTVSLPSHVRFNGSNAVELRQVKPNSADVLVDGQSDVSVENLILTGIGATDSTATVTNASFYNASPTNQAFGVWTRNAERIRVRGNTITNHRGAGVFNWKPKRDIWVEDNYISGTYPEAGLPAGDGNYSQFGVALEQTDQQSALPVIGTRFYIGKNTIEKVAHGVFVAPGFDYVTIDANYWGTLQQHGFYVYPTSNLTITKNHGDSYVGAKVQSLPGNTKTNPTSIRVEGNILSSDQAPSLQVLVADEVSGSTNIRSSTYLDGVTVAGNTLSSRNHSALLMTSVRNAVVTGNVITSAAKAGIYTYQVAGRFEQNTINDACSTLEPVNLGVAAYHTTIFRGNSILNARAGCLAYLTAAWNASIGPPIAWAASKYHGKGVYATNGGNVYRAATGGVSAGSVGPTGTGTGIVDGTDGLTWDYVIDSANMDKGTIVLDGNYVGTTSSEPTHALVVGGTNLVLRSNRLPFTTKDVYINATLVSLEDDGNNVHGGFLAGSPYATGGVVTPGRPGRDFMSDSLPAANCQAPYNRRDRIWNLATTAGGAVFWDCVTVGSTWKAVNAAP